MKRILVVILTIVCLFSLMSFACAADDTWHCDTCNEDRDTPFCPVCGNPRPEAQEETSSNRPWSVRELVETDTKLKTLANDDQRHQSYFGPAKSYPGDGAYKPYKASRVKALFREGNFVLTDLTYQTVGRRILYFSVSSLTNIDVENVTLTGFPAKTIGSIIPKQGPGSEYDDLLQTRKQNLSDYIHSSWIHYDDEINEWVETEVWTDPKTGDSIFEPKTERFAIYLKEGAEINVFFETNGWVFAEFECSLGKVRAWLPVATIE